MFTPRSIPRGLVIASLVLGCTTTVVAESEQSLDVTPQPLIQQADGLGAVTAFMPPGMNIGPGRHRHRTHLAWLLALIYHLVHGDGPDDPPPNQIPVITAGPSAMPNPVLVGESTALSVSASDGDDDMLSYEWLVSEGPGPVTIADPQAASTTANFANEGLYTLTIMVSDGQDVVSETIDVTVNSDTQPPQNQAPEITSGPSASPQSIALDASSSLSVTASDADGDDLSYAWSQIGGPGTASFSTAEAITTEVRFDQVGDYELQVVVSDGQDEAMASVMVNVSDDPPPPPPPPGDNILLDGDFSLAEDAWVRGGGWALSTKEDQVGQGWIVNSTSRWSRDATHGWIYINSGTDAANMVQIVHDQGQSIGVHQLTLDVLNLGEGSNNGVAVMVYAVDEPFRINLFVDDGPVTDEQVPIPNTLLGEMIINEKADWSPMTIDNIDLGTGHDYIVVMVRALQRNIDPAIRQVQVDNVVLAPPASGNG